MPESKVMVFGLETGNKKVSFPTEEEALEFGCRYNSKCEKKDGYYIFNIESVALRDWLNMQKNSKDQNKMFENEIKSKLSKCHAFISDTKDGKKISFLTQDEAVLFGARYHLQFTKTENGHYTFEVKTDLLYNKLFPQNKELTDHPKPK